MKTATKEIGKERVLLFVPENDNDRIVIDKLHRLQDDISGYNKYLRKFVWTVWLKLKFLS